MDTRQLVSDAVKGFLSDDQDPAQVERAYAKVSEILTSGEVMEYIAVQKPLMALTPDCIVLTNKRFIVYRPRAFGRVDFEDHIWRDLGDAHLAHGVISSTLTMKTVQGKLLVIEHLPRKQANRLYAVAQEKEELVREERRQRELEEKRAAAGQYITTVTTPTAQPQVPAQPSISAPPAEDPVAKLKQLKAMLDAGLIEQAEYDAKKAEILSRM